MTLNHIERIGKLRALVRAVGGRIDTRKKFHKLVYLLQQKGEDFGEDYSFYDYGPYSPTLAADLELASDQQIGAIEAKESHSVGYRKYHYVLPTGMNEWWGTEIPLSTEAVGLATELSQEDSRLLEVLGTIVYLDRRHYKERALRDKLQELKPKLSDFFEKAFDLAKKHFGVS